MKTKTVLWEARKALKEGKRDAARAMLKELLRSEPDNAAAWLLLFNALDDPLEKMDALKQAQRIRPQDETIRQRIHKYKASAGYRALKAGQQEAKKQAAERVKSEREHQQGWRAAVSAFFRRLFPR